MKVKKIEVRDFKGICGSWDKSRILSQEELSRIDESFVCYNRMLPIYACLLIHVPLRREVYWFTISNPYVNSLKKEGGLNFLLKKMTQLTDKRGKGYNFVQIRFEDYFKEKQEQEQQENLWVI